MGPESGDAGDGKLCHSSATMTVISLISAALFDNTPQDREGGAGDDLDGGEMWLQQQRR